jgi:autotransporter-associated beta strand protein
VQFISARSPSTIWVDVASGTQTQAQARASILTGTAGLTKTGTGTLSLTVSNTYGGATRVTSGRLMLAHPRAIMSSTASVSAGATLAVASGVDAVVRGLDFSEGGRIDLARGSLTVTGSLATSTVLAELAKGRAGGMWSGTSGIMSSTIAEDLAAGRSRAIGWTDTGGGSVKFASAALGDMNLDGLIDILDVAGFLNAGKFDSGQPAVWDEGDVTYDGVVDVLDAVEFVASASFDAGPYAAAGAAVTVPEPGGGLVALAAGIAVVVGRALGGRISPMRRGLLSF